MLYNFMDPAILFFVFGVLAGLVKSNLEIPQPISKFLSLYLLMALGLKGGFALSQSGLSLEVIKGLGAALALALIVPLVGYQILKRLTGPYDAAAIAATYGSVSAVTFITSVQFLDTQNIAYSGHMSAAMAVMESPAILLAVLWVNSIRSHTNPTSASQHGLKQTLHESVTDGAQLLLLGAMAVGMLTGDVHRERVELCARSLATVGRAARRRATSSRRASSSRARTAWRAATRATSPCPCGTSGTASCWA